VAEPDIEPDFENLFSKVPIKNSKTGAGAGSKAAKAVTATPKQESVKILDSKRSQAIGILISSKRLDACVIRDAVMGFDNQLLSIETLNSIYAIRPQDDEIRAIQDYIKSAAENFNEELLDKPELFLLELSRISAFEERLYCLVYQNRFNESISSIEFRLNNINTICEDLTTSEKIKKLLGVILACGNIMNSANKTRGDADGFDLAILPNLKDVKSKDNTSNLVQYIAAHYINKVDEEKMPLPDPSDFNFVATVSFEELEKELRRVSNELKNIEERVDTVLKLSSPLQSPTTENPPSQLNVEEVEDSLLSLNEQFKTRVLEFLKEARENTKEQEEMLDKCRTKFKKLVTIYCTKPRPSDNEVTPEYFFTLWAGFCSDFKDAWKREKQKLTKLRYELFFLILKFFFLYLEF
jgi:hypothetical protein